MSEPLANASAILLPMVESISNLALPQKTEIEDLKEHEPILRRDVTPRTLPDISPDAMRQTLLDSDGRDIKDYKAWYKIMLGDGSELGYTTTTTIIPGITTLNCGPRPAGQGAIFRLWRDADDNSPEEWHVGQKKKLICIAMDTSGVSKVRFLGFSKRNPWVLQFTEHEKGEQGVGHFTAWRAPGKRVLLAAETAHGLFPPLRVQYMASVGQRGGMEIHGATDVEDFTPLECKFVRFGPPPNTAWGFDVPRE